MNPTESVFSLNDGIESTRGRFVAVLDADDKFLTLFLERTTRELDDRPDIDFVYTDYYAESVYGGREHVDTPICRGGRERGSNLKGLSEILLPPILNNALRGSAMRVLSRYVKCR